MPSSACKKTNSAVMPMCHRTIASGGSPPQTGSGRSPIEPCRGAVSWYGFFLFNDTATTEISTLSLHDALPIFRQTGERSVTTVLGLSALAGILVCPIPALLARATWPQRAPAAGLVLWQAIG